METVKAYCRQCDHHLGALLNLWVQIGKSYISPVIQIEDALDVNSEGAVRQGEKGTIVDNCHLQEVVCGRCNSTLGSKCLSSTVNHVLRDGQLLLRISSIQIKDLDGHVPTNPIIQRLLKLKNPSVDQIWSEHGSEDGSHGPGFSKDYKYEQAMNQNPELSTLLNNMDAQKQEIDRLDVAGYQVVASFNLAVNRIDEELRKMKDEMAQVTGDSSDSKTKTKGLTSDILSAKTEINEIKTSLRSLATQSRLEQGLSSVGSTIAENITALQVDLSDKWDSHRQRLSLLESELESARLGLTEFKTLLENTRTSAKTALSASDTNTKEIALLRAELQNLRQEPALDQSHKFSLTNHGLASREIDILARNITKIGQRASQVEALQMELELLKTRVGGIDKQPTASQRLPNASLPQHSQLVSSKRKAPSDRYAEGDIDHNVSLSAPPNVEEDHVSWSGSHTTRLTILDSPPPAKAPRHMAEPSALRTTKSGAVDKRTLRKRGPKPQTTVRKGKG